MFIIVTIDVITMLVIVVLLLLMMTNGVCVLNSLIAVHRHLVDINLRTSGFPMDYNLGYINPAVYIGSWYWTRRTISSFLYDEILAALLSVAASTNMN